MKKSKIDNYETIKQNPTKEELNYYKNNMENILPVIKKMMKGRSREEHLLAQDNFKKYAELIYKVEMRISKEKYIENQTKIISQEKITHKISVDKQVKQARLF